MSDNNSTNNKSSNNNSTNNNSTNNKSTNNKSTDNNSNKSTDNNTNKKTKLSDNILLYIIIFAILFIVLLIVLTWTLDVISKLNSCQTYPNIWCSDKWICNKQCPPPTSNTDDFRDCFRQPTTTKEPTAGETGLAQCLFGIDSKLATFQDTNCPAGPNENPNSCILPCNMTTDNGTPENNCLLGCPVYNTNSEPTSTTCCCCPGTTNCNITRCTYCDYLKSGATSDPCFEKIKSQDTTINAYCRVDCTTPCPPKS